MLDATSAADLELVRAGVSLPWSVLGGRLGESAPEGVAVIVPASDLGAVEAAGELVLTDKTLLPVALLREVTLGQLAAADDSPQDAPAYRAGGTVEHLGPAVPGPSWTAFPGRTVLLQRPPLLGELDEWLDAAADMCVQILVPTRPTPDGLPAQVLRRGVLGLLAGREVDVVSVPVAWRDAASDVELVKSIAEAAGSPLEVLWAQDERWVRARALVDRGTNTDDLDEPVAAALLTWRPPPTERGVVVFFTGLSGSGKSSIADALVAHLEHTGERAVTLLDGDVVRHMLSSGLGFDRAARDLNIRRIGYVAAEIAHHHGMAVCAPIAPFAATRQAVREMVEQFGDFVLVHISTPLEECERRDRKGLYARARAGEIPEFTGISSPYESPTDADLTIDTTGRPLQECLTEVLDALIRKGYLTS
ncbi:adenylyl-sulfate kinase [Lapillicoccus sp.]|uniref:adenylyl-sulfate kinase n=1 Tax=Lapillicoccus sp. TaxID=1909287 RepID=UPI00326721D2